MFNTSIDDNDKCDSYGSIKVLRVQITATDFENGNWLYI